MDPIKIVGAWRRGGKLESGVYLLKSELPEAKVVAIKVSDGGLPHREYLGPIEIVDPERFRRRCLGVSVTMEGQPS